jgi:hypothetical protein
VCKLKMDLTPVWLYCITITVKIRTWFSCYFEGWILLQSKINIYFLHISEANMFCWFYISFFLFEKHNGPNFKHFDVEMEQRYICISISYEKPMIFSFSSLEKSWYKKAVRTKCVSSRNIHLFGWLVLTAH